MKDHYVLRWLKAALIRALKTFAQTAAAGLTVGATIQEINWTGLLSASALAFLYSMLTSCAGLPEVQAEADFVCGTNDEDGVARFLEEWLLKGDM